MGGGSGNQVGKVGAIGCLPLAYNAVADEVSWGGDQKVLAKAFIRKRKVGRNKRSAFAPHVAAGFGEALNKSSLSGLLVKSG